MAAEQGSMEGQAFFGLYQINGEAGVEKNPQEGIALIEKAYKQSQRNSFEKNCPEAAKALAEHYAENGKAAERGKAAQGRLDKGNKIALWG